MGFFDKIKEGLRKTKEAAANNVNAVLATFRKVDEEMLSELEDSLILADLGAELAMTTVDELRKRAKLKDIGESQ